MSDHFTLLYFTLTETKDAYSDRYKTLYDSGVANGGGAVGAIAPRRTGRRQNIVGLVVHAAELNWKWIFFYEKRSVA